MARNTLSNLAKRQVAFSGQADVGDVPELYAMQDAMAAERAANMGGTPGLGSGSGGTVPMPTATGGGGAVGGAADVGLPGPGFENQDIERLYTQAFRGDGGADRGDVAGRGAINFDPADPFGLDFGQGLQTATQIAGLLGIPGMGMANQFVNLMMQDANMRSDAFFEGLISGEAPVDPTSGITMGRTSSTQLDSGADMSEADFGAGLATGELQGPPGNSGISMERRTGNEVGGGVNQGGDAGSGGGGGGGGDGFGCFAKGTTVLMADGTEKLIEQIDLGDKVMGFNEGDDPEPCEVIGRFAHRSKPVWRLNGNTLVTPMHRFFALIGTDGYGFWPLEEIPLGAKIMVGDGSSVTVETIEDAGEQRDVFNLTVQRMHTYIANGYRVHNIKHNGGYISEARVPGQRRSDVPETLQEGEHVMSADAVDMLGGPAFFHGMNTMARLARKR